MFDPAQIKSRAVYNHPETYYGLCVDHVSGRMYAGSSDYGIHVIDLAAEKKEPVARWPGHDNYVAALACVDRPGGKWIASGGYDRQLIWWNAESGEVIRRVEAHTGWIRDVRVVPGTGLLATVGDDMLLKLWEIETGSPVRSFAGHAQRTPQGHVTALYVVAPSADGKYLATGDRIGEVRVWETATGNLVQTFQVPLLYTYDPVQRKRSIGGIRSMAFSPDSSRIAAGGINQINNVDGLQAPLHVELWDWRQPQRLAAFAAEGHQAIINELAFHPTEPWLVGAGGGSNNGVLASWKLDPLPSPPPEAEREKPWPTTNGPKLVLEGHIHRLAFKPDWTTIYAAGFRKAEVFSVG